MKTFAERLRAARKAAGFRTRRKAAAALGMLEGTYNYYERGQSTPLMPMLVRICLLYNVEPNYLLPFAIREAGEKNESVEKKSLTGNETSS